MTLTIELPPAVEARLQAAARTQGVDPAEIARTLLEEYLPPVTERIGSHPERDPELVARVRAARGKFAGTANGLASEELHRERQRDKEKEEQRIQGYRP